MSNKLRYNSFNRYLLSKYGQKVRKIGLNASFTCPNRDGTLGVDGCIFCNEAAFSDFAPDSCHPERSEGSNNIVPPITEQIEHYIEVFGSKGVDKCIAYFQNASGTNAPIEELKVTYDTIKKYKEIVALSISTRPDCIDEEKLDLISRYTNDYEVWIEYGVQTSLDASLEKTRRRHTFQQSVDAIKKTADRGINVVAHVILGLPGETAKDMVSTAKILAALPVNGIKLHAFHVLKGTELEKMYVGARHAVLLLSEDEYVQRACDFLENLRSDQLILRLVSDARDEYLIAPAWMRNKILVIRKINVEFERRGTCQGSLYA